MIELNDKWRLLSDGNNWILEQKKIKGKKSKNEGVEFWETEGYFGTIGHAISFLIEREVRVTDNIIELSDKIEQLKTELRFKYDEFKKEGL